MTAARLARSAIVLPHLFREAEAGSPFLSGMALAFLAFFAFTYSGTLIDERLINGVSVWDKPAKFFLSLTVHMATLAWGLSLLSPSERNSPAIIRATRIFLAAAIFEMGYITYRAALGEPSHFNTTTTVSTVMYALMGLGAVTLAAVTAFIGWRILKHAEGSTVAFAVGLGFILGGLLAVAFGGYMSQQGGHWVGGVASDATGLPFFHWSTTGGDLRVAHFFGLHAMQALPLAGYLLRDRGIGLAWAAAGLWTLLAVATFVQALLGMPLLG